MKLVLVVTDHPRSYGYGTWGEVLEQSLAGVGDLFALGMLAAAFLAITPDAARARLRTIALVTAVIGVLVGIGATDTGLADLRLAITAWGIGCVALVLAVALSPSEPSRLLRVLESRALVFVGLASYSLYLWHEPVIHWLSRHDLLAEGTPTALTVDLAIVLAISLAVAALSFRFVEKPALRRKRSTGPAATDHRSTSKSPVTGSTR